MDAFQSRIGGELQPLLGELTRATENLAAASGVTVGQARRIDSLVGEVAGGVSRTRRRRCRNVVVPAAARLVSLTAAVRVRARGGLSLLPARARAWRPLAPATSPSRSAPRTSCA